MNSNDLKRILLIEDDAKDVTLTLDAMKQYQLANDVMVTRDGEEGLDYLFRRGKFSGRTNGDPAVVLLDLKMPKVDGIEVLREMKAEAKLKTIPIVILTSSRESRDLDECYKLGVNAYVVKPVKFLDFIEAVKGLAVFWAIINEPPSSTLKKK